MQRESVTRKQHGFGIDLDGGQTRQEEKKQTEKEKGR